MLSYIQDFFKNKQVKKVKPPIRDKYGRAYYLKEVPLFLRYPKSSFTAAFAAVLLAFFSFPIYGHYFKKPNPRDPQDGWWYHERQQGKRDIDIIRERKAEYPDAPIRYFFEPYNAGEEQHRQVQIMKLEAAMAEEANALLASGNWKPPSFKPIVKT